MILTITMNPSVDINYQLDSLQLDNVNRVSTVSKTAGGKGLNVARVLSQLDESVATTGLLGGTIGDYIKNQLHDQKIP
ncbi:MAG: PfkB family carbohydrate kinase, partial [Alkalibacterium gilvum]